TAGSRRHARGEGVRAAGPGIIAERCGMEPHTGQIPIGRAITLDRSSPEGRPRGDPHHAPAGTQRGRGTFHGTEGGQSTIGIDPQQRRSTAAYIENRIGLTRDRSGQGEKRGGGGRSEDGATHRGSGLWLVRTRSNLSGSNWGCGSLQREASPEKITPAA